MTLYFDPEPAVDNLSAAKRALLSRWRLGQAVPAAAGIPRRPAGAEVPLSFAQERLWFLHQLDPGSPAYNMPGAFLLEGEIDLTSFIAAIDEVRRRHEVLRTRFVVREGRPVQEAEPFQRSSPWIADLSALEDGRAAAEARRLAAEEALLPFDLARGPLFRVRVLRIGVSEHLVLATLHHAVGDGWSIRLLVEEVAAAYSSLAAGRLPAWPELPIQYGDFAAWQRDWLAGERLHSLLGHWRGRLETAAEPLELPTDRPRPAVQGHRGAWRTAFADLDLQQALQALARNESCTLYMVLLAGFQILMARYSGQDRISVGSPIANRERTELERLIGFFANTLVMRTDLSGDPEVQEVLARVRAVAMDAYAHQDMPFDLLVQDLAPERDLARNPLFQVAMALQDGVLPEVRLGEARLSPYSLEQRTAKFDLFLACTETPDGLLLELEFNTDLFDPATALRLLGHFENLLESAAGDPTSRLSAVNLLSQAERWQLSGEWNDEAWDVEGEETIHGLFRARAAVCPESLALVSGDRRWNYRELAAQADGWSRRLRSLGVGPEARVGLLLERSAEAVIAMLAVLQAGGAYVPLDPGYPEERLRLLLEDTGCAVVVTRRELSERPCLSGRRLLRVDEEAGAEEPAAPPEPEAVPDQLAYLMFTSGSQGRPKGVAVVHRGVVRLVQRARYASFGPEEVWLQLVPLAFDVSTLEVWGALLHGGTLVVPPPGVLSPAELGELVESTGVTSLWLTSGYFRQVVDAGLAGFEGVRQLLAGGDVVPAEHARRLLARLPGCTLINGYGPTENTTFTCCEPVRPGSAVGASVPVGRPLPGTSVHVLDGSGCPAPVGIPGELFTGGAGLARNYWGRPDLTAERFVPDPVGASPGARLYRTGDLVRTLADGRIEFLGRIDGQVKVRGFRVEPGEIEAVLARHPAVRECAVVARPDRSGEKRLLAYYAALSPVGVAELRGHLQTELPPHLVPTSWVELERLPLTANGKVDRRALPEPQEREETEAAGRTEPRTVWEELVAGVFREVLGEERLGLEESFFERGGHSLLATQAVSRLRELTGTAVELRWMFESPSAEALAARLGEAAGGVSRRLPPIRRVPRDQFLPLSFAQERLWFVEQMRPGTGTYNVFQALRLTGPLSVPALDLALQEVVRRQEALRTVFRVVGGRPVQEVLPSGERLAFADLSGVDAEAEWRRLAGEEIARPFSLETGPLVRWRLFRCAPEEHILLANLHHIVADGWSMGVLLREVSRLYTAFSGGDRPALEGLEIQYPDYAVWQREWLEGGVLEEELSFWRRRLAGAPRSLELPLDRPRPAVQSPRGAALPVRWSRELTASLEALARRHGATLFMVLLAGLDTLLARYSGQEDILVGTPVANRGRREIEGLIGFFVNMLVMRTEVSGSLPFRDLLARVRTGALEAFAHQDVPFERVVDALVPDSDPSRNALFQVVLAVQNAPLPRLELGGVRLDPVELPWQTSKFDATLILTPIHGELAGYLEYCTDLFEPATMKRLLGHLETLLGAAADDDRAHVQDLPLLSAAERWQLSGEWNDAAWETEGEGTIHGLFAAQAAARPEALALVAGERRWSYGELAALSSAQARRLKSLGVGPETRVALLLERSAEAIIAMLAVLHAGGAYVPLDPGYPEERLRLLLEDTDCPVVVTRRELAHRPCLSERRLLLVDEELLVEPEASPEPEVGPDHLAYLMFTSGSQGRPKGVAVVHRGVVRLVQRSRFASFGPDEVWLQLAPLSFDASTLEIWGALLQGGTLVVAPPGALSPAELGELVASTGVTSLWLTAGFFHQVVDGGLSGLEGVRQLLAGGDVVSPSHTRRLLEQLPGCTLINGYGPTENTTFTCCEPVRSVSSIGASVPVGRPVTGTSVHVLDGSWRPVPVGVPGELFTGGAGLSRGYWGRPDLTAERFVPDPAGRSLGGRLYRTGDLVRALSDGRIEFLGRIDAQVKVRGFRVEPGEIEAVLSRHPGVRECVVVARPDRSGEKRLVAYYAASGPVEAGELRSHLQAELPPHLVPTSWVELERLPLTANGKVDRRALPEPEEREEAETAGRTEPRTVWEELVAGVFREVLGSERLGLEESFFERGGHSLLATQAVSRLRELSGTAVELRWIFESPSAEELAARLEETAGGISKRLPPIRRVPRDQPLPLSFAQERLWFLERLEPGGAAYNVPALVRLSGHLRPEVLQAAVEAIVRRHGALRTRFLESGGWPVQEVLPDQRVEMPRIDLSGLPADLGAAEARRLARRESAHGFDLAAGPLLRLLLIRLTDREHLAFLNVHHVVWDGWSLGVFLHELGELYTAGVEGRAAALAEPPVQYADFSVWQRETLRGEVLEALLGHWRERLAGAPVALELPADRPREAAGDAGAWLRTRPPLALTQHLGRLCRREGVTPFMALLAAFAAVLARYSGQEDLVIGSPIANRNRRETEGLIGFFVNTLALRVDLSGAPAFRKLLSRVREATLAAYEHQDLPFERLVEALQPERALSRSPLFQVMLIVQNTPRPELRLPDLDLELLDLGAETAAFDLTLAVEGAGSAPAWDWEFRRGLFDPATILRLAGHVERLLTGVAEEPERALAELPLTSDAEVQQVLREWNGGPEPGGESLFQSLFAARVAGSPGAWALTDAATGERLTYRDLDRRANRLAHGLARLGVGPDVRVGLEMPRSVRMIVAMVAVLKAGGAYVPLDPEVPEERLAAMREMAGLTLRLTGAEDFSVPEESEPAPGALPASAAYVVFTSGSTGRPKGVAVSHSSLAWYAAQAARAYGFGVGERVLQFSALAFDTSVEEIFCALASGAELVLRDQGSAGSVAELYRLIEAYGVTSLHVPTAYWHEMVADPALLPSGLRRVVIGGERVLPERVEAWRARQGREPRLFNSYGPTEATVVATVLDLAGEGAVPPWEAAAIGRPLRGAEVYVLDAGLRPVPAGVPGELCLGGAGVARGYLDQAAETAARFIPHPFASTPGARLYRTGDRARFLPDGTLAFLGRLDAQVKIRGFRVEPGEVESALADLPGVRGAAVIAAEGKGGARRLAAFVVLSHGSAEALRAALASRLPDYLVPSAFVVVDELPLLPNGKIDRRSLAEAFAERAPEETPVSLVASPVEELLAGLWAEVLGLPAVSRHDSFFDLGGHSLLATQVVSRVRAVFGVELPLRRLFETPTVAGVARWIADTRAGGGAGEAQPIHRRPAGAPAPLSFAQERLWFLDQLTPGAATYNLPAAVRLAGDLDVPALAAALSEIVRRHEALRTSFPAEGGQPRQRIEAEARLPLPQADLRGLPEEERRAELSRLIGDEAARPFDLARGPLIRVLLARLAPRENVLSCVMHHIVSDGWSIEVFTSELAGLYGAFTAGRPSPLRELEVQYADFAAWQRQVLGGETLDRQLDFWRHYLAGAPSVLELPADRPRPAVQSFRGAHLPLDLPDGLAAGVAALARERGVTPFMVLLTAFQLLLARYSGQEDLLVGSPIANRNHAETEGLIGFFVNTLTLRGRLAGEARFGELLAEARESILAAYANQDLPFEKLVEELAPRRSLSHSPLFQVFFALQNLPPARFELPGLELSPVELENPVAKFDLSLDLEPAGGGFHGVLEYSLDLFDRSTAVRMAEHYRSLLAHIVAAPGVPVWDIPLLGTAEWEQIACWNETAAPIADRRVHELFEEQARRAPDAVALVFRDLALTYGELDAQAGQLARRLRAAGAGPDDLVGLSAERSLDMVVGLLGILKAGAAYLPLDPGYPLERLAAMTGDGGVRVALVQEPLVERLSPVLEGRTVLTFDGTAAPAAPALPSVPTESLAYVLFTSGSTGRPKGVQIPHHAFVNLLTAMARWPGIAAGDVVVTIATLSFDIASFELLAPLLVGARVVIAPAETVTDGAALGELLDRSGATMLQATPATWRLLLEAGWRGRKGLKILSGGEAMANDLADRLLGTSEAPAGVFNCYGPTETTVYSTGGEVLAGDRPVPIGLPLANTRVYVLDRRGNPLPVGVPGELYIGGAGLARGYASQPGLTAERFVPDSFSGLPGERLYRSGDLVRLRAGGVIDYLGRIDHQVKVRGFRIELGEIEAALLSLPRVARAVVTVREDRPGDRRITAYVVPVEEGEALSPASLRQALKASLPEYMLPADVVVLPALPLLPSGKVDRRSLPRPEAGEPAAGDGRLWTVWEELVGGVFQEILGRERIGLEESFFDAGGHSLLATQAVARLRDLAGRPVELRWLFETPTAAGLAGRLEALAGSPAKSLPPPVRSVTRQGGAPLSFSQERLWFLERLQPGTGAYNVFQALRLEGALDPEALERSLGEVVRRHESLRTVFTVRDGSPVQEVSDGLAASSFRIDLSSLEDPGEWRRLAEEEAARPFDLERGPLVRWHLLRLGEDDHILLLNLHHIVADAWSMGILLRETAEAYRAFACGEEPRLPVLGLQYADYAVWQREWLSGDVLAEEIGFWRERLAGAPGGLDLPTDRPRPTLQSLRGGTLPVAFEPGLVAGLERLGRRHGATLFMVLLAGFDTLLARYSGQEDVLVGAPVAQRTRREVEDLIGFFVNTLVLRTDLSGSPSFEALLGRVRETALAAYGHQDLPFEKLVEEVAPERNLSHSALFQVMLALQNTPAPDAGLGDVRMSALELPGRTSKFDLTLSLTPGDGWLRGFLEYSADLFDPASMRRFLGHFETLLAAACAEPGRPFRDLPLLPAGERLQLLAEWNDTALSFPVDLCLHEMFEAQVARTPEAVALEWGEERMTYRELDDRATRLARYLRRMGAGPDQVVGLCVERSERMGVGLFGVLKAGGAYLPLDPSYPDDRLAFMLEDSGASVLLSEESFHGRFGGFTGALILLDVLDGTAPEAPPVTRGAAPENLAYVLYTSGSTGRPKGAMIPHSAIVNHMFWMQRCFPLGPEDSVLQKTPFSFDASVWEFYAPLLVGGRLVLARPGAHRDPAYLAGEIAARGITILQVVPTLLDLLLGEPRFRDCRSLKRVFCGGEALTPEVAGRFHEQLGADLINVYGPTEATIHSSSSVLRAGDPQGIPAIGRPIDNGWVRVLDPAGAPVPIGVPGQLFVGGANLGRGYLRRPGLTAERFVPDPLAEAPGERLYATGDLVRHLPDGRLEFLGRIDHQVKLRGLRIELGEIEKTLLSAPGVRHAVVVLRESPSGKVLAAYAVPEPAAALSPADLKEHLRNDLPGYMVPDHVTLLEKLPLLPNGKVDRRALPAPDPEAADSAGRLAAPRTPLEATLREIWVEILGRGDLGIHDNFFESGGHSLSAARLASRLRQVTGAEVPLLTLFEAPTVAGLAARLEEIRGTLRPSAPPIAPVRRDQPLPLSSGQERLWFLEALQPGGSAYNLPLAMRLLGELDLAAAHGALRGIERRHEILRTTFPDLDGRPVQRIAEAPGHVPSLVDLSGLPAAARDAEALRVARAEANRPFDLAAGPLWRTLFLRWTGGEHALVLTQHHIIGDGWSTGLFINEFGELYEAARTSRPARLAALPIQYADYVVWQREWLRDQAFEHQLAFWRERLAGATAVLNLPLDRPRFAVRGSRGAEIEVLLPEGLANAARECSRRSGVTLFMLLLASFQTLLARVSGQDDVLVGTPVAGRGRAEVEGLLGLFANTLVMRGGPVGNPSFPEILARTRGAALDAFAHQDLPFEKLVEELQPERDLSVSPIFQVLFSLQNVPLPRLGLPELELEPFPIPSGGARFDLVLEVTEVPQGLAVRWEYSTDLFDAVTVRRLAWRLASLLEDAVALPGKRVSELELLGAAERQQLLVEWNDTALPLPEAGIVQAFEDQADLTPDRVALVSEEGSATYRELDQRANALAHRLIALGVGPDTIVGLCLPRTRDLVAAMLAILKAGGAYLPLDPSYPAERLALMLEDSRAPVLVATRELAGSLNAGGAELLDPGLEPDAVSPVRPDIACAPESLAYVIYTSGSTGRPKGVMVPCGAVTNFFRGMDLRLGHEPPGTWLAVTSVSFDISVLEILWTLGRGFSVVLQKEQAQLAAGALERAGHATREIDFSLFFFASEEREDEPRPRKYRLLFEAARFADEHGFAAVWTPERHFHAFGGLYPNPSVTGAALAARTKRVQIRAGSVVLPLHHPIRVAEEWAVVDNISEGRVGISFASGWHPDDFVFAPGGYARRKELMFEGIETVRKLWRGEAVTAEGGAGAPVEVRIRPRPVQPELPVWVTAAGSPETFRMAGEIGAHVLTHLLGQDLDVLAANIAVYRAAWRPAEGGPREGRVSLMLHTFLGSDLEAVRETVRAPFTGYLRSAVGLLRGLAASLGRDMDDDGFSDEDMQALLAHAFDRYFETSSLFGTPDTCRVMLDRLRAAGVDEAACLIDFGVETDAVLDSLRFLDEVRRTSRREALAAGEAGDTSLSAQIARHGVTHLQCTPSMAGMLAIDPAAKQAIGRLQRLMLGGEPLPPSLLDQLREGMEGEIHNMYGPTETTIWSATRRMERTPGSPVTIGRAIANTSLLLLDASGGPVPAGVPGELFIGGAGVVRGYFGRPELTAERFVPDPWSGIPGARLYRTGDLARFRPDGEIEFLGRIDHQVKIRGFRIELEEIAVALGRYPEVREAVVVLREDRPGDRRLAAYYIPLEGKAPAPAELKAFLARTLPDYMVPSAFVRMESFPLTPNRKIDRKALPAPEVEEGAAGGPASPRTPMETVLAGIWADVLRRDTVGVHDNFFELGGHSLLATQLLLRVREVVGRDIPLRIVFESPTVAAMSERIESLAQEESGIERPPLGPALRRAFHPLSYAQQRIWVLDQLTPGTWAYNDHSAVRLRGPLDLAAFRRSLTEILRRHEALRTNFVLVDGRPAQLVRPAEEAPLPFVDLSGFGEDRRAEAVAAAARDMARYIFDLSGEPLLRLCLLRLAPEEHVLVLVVHHIVWDGWSMMVFVRELSALYNAFGRGLPSPLEELPVQYIDFAEWQLDWLKDEAIENLLVFWRRELEGAPVLRLPTDRPRPPVQTFRGTRYGFELRPGLAAELQGLCRREGATLFMALLAGFQTLLALQSGQEDFVVGTDVANRGAVEAEQLIGFFVNQIVLRADLSGDPSFAELLKRTRRTALAGYAHQDLPFDRLVSGLQLGRDLNQTPLFQVKFVLQNVPPHADDLAELELRPLELDWNSSKFDLLLNLTEIDGALSGSMEYSSDLFNPATIQKLCADYGRLLEIVAGDPALPLSGLRERLASLEERDRALDRSEREKRSLDLLQKVKRRIGGKRREIES